MNAEPVPTISARPIAGTVTSHGDAALLEIRDLTVRFVTREATVHAVNGVKACGLARSCASWGSQGPVRA
jgi:hypothetical protein